MWKENYKIGADQIDQQHRQLFLIAGDLVNAVREEAENQQNVCKQTIDFLKTYVVVHFGAEEMLQDKINYSDIVNHKKMHRALADDLREWEFTLMRSDFALETIGEFTLFLKRWLIYHSLREDKKMAPEIAEYYKNNDLNGTEKKE